MLWRRLRFDVTIAVCDYCSKLSFFVRQVPFSGLLHVVGLVYAKGSWPLLFGGLKLSIFEVRELFRKTFFSFFGFQTGAGRARLVR